MPTGEELHSRAVWQTGSSIGFIAHKTGKDRSSVCHKIAKNERHKRFSTCTALKEGKPAHDRERPKSRHSDPALAHRGGASVPQAGRRHLRLEYGGRYVVEPLDYSAGRSRPPPSRQSPPERDKQFARHGEGHESSWGRAVLLLRAAPLLAEADG
ncbi:MAG: hypothetical protein DUD39_03560 [Coriobacteriaceae bacterium]|nr:MAG: hypothetical protein DUD39_03560 [Coriobacteriaceae bacterium]